MKFDVIDTGDPTVDPAMFPNPVSPVLRSNLAIAPIEFPGITEDVFDPAAMANYQIRFVNVDDSSKVTVPLTVKLLTVAWLLTTKLSVLSV